MSARYPEFTPVRAVELEQEGEGVADGVGAIRVQSVAGPPLRERVLVHDRPRVFEYEVLSGLPGVASYRGRQTFTDEGDGTRVNYEVEFEPTRRGMGFAVSATLRAAIESLMLLASREAPKRAAEQASRSA